MIRSVYSMADNAITALSDLIPGGTIPQPAELA